MRRYAMEITLLKQNEMFKEQESTTLRQESALLKQENDELKNQIEQLLDPKGKKKKKK